MRREGTPTPRRIVAVYVLLGLVSLTGVVGLTHALRHDLPAVASVHSSADGAVDPLRQVVECPLPAPREGQPTASGRRPPPLMDVGSVALLDCPTTWDGRRVRFVGEVVGAVLDRGGHAWTQLNDDDYADGSGPLPTHLAFSGANAGIGARLRPTDAAALTVGGPGVRGDLVEAIATFRRVDRDSAEVAILDVESLTVLREGGPVDLPQASARPVAAGIAAVLAVGVVVVERRWRAAR